MIGVPQGIQLPQKEETHLAQAEVNKALYLAVKREADRRGITFRSVVEWALRIYLFMANPKEALKLGISKDTMGIKEKD